jgi:hypothetical protein
MWTARNVLFGARDAKTGETWEPAPQMDNIIQAAHYMWKLNVPYKLVYKAYSQLGQSSDSWATKVINIPAPGEKNSEYIDFDNYGKMKGMKQFEIVYDLRIDKKGRVQYKREDDPTWSNTIVTVQDIERYFNYVAEMGPGKELGPRPMTIKHDGEKQNYSSCNYCPLKQTCDSYEEAGYETWLSEVKKVLQ